LEIQEELGDLVTEKISVTIFLNYMTTIRLFSAQVSLLFWSEVKLRQIKFHAPIGSILKNDGMPFIK
jgi:hypothetical protein